MRTYNSVQEAYFNSLKELIDKGDKVNSVSDATSIGSFFGERKRDFVELLGFSFVLTNPRNRLIYSSSRRLSFGFNIANLIWLISGRNDVETISFYNKLGSVYSSSGTYYEAAFGDRIFGNLKLWESAKKILSSDITTRRALMPIFIPNDLKNLPKDTPCASSIQIMIRKQKVDFFLHMRSQSVAMVFPYDIFLFTMLHEYISQMFDLPMGSFHYYCNSFHYYVEEENKIRDILKEEIEIPNEMPKMCKTSDELIKDILNIEETLRMNCIKGIKTSVNTFNHIPEYWRSLLEILFLKANKESHIELENVDSFYLRDNRLYI